MNTLAVVDRKDYQLILAPEKPCWAATNRPGAALVTELAEAGENILPQRAAELADSLGLKLSEAEELVRSVALESAPVWQQNGTDGYLGRAAYLRPAHLREVWFHLNDRCNFTCRHCLVSSGPHGRDGLPPAAVRGLVEEALSLGCRTFFFTGGEPLLRPDLADLLHVCLESSETHAVVLTNGSLINRAFLETVRDLDPERFHLQISVDGVTPAVNDRIRSAGAFALTLKGLRQAITAGIDVTVATVVLKANVAELPMFPVRLAEWGVRRWHLLWQHVRDRGAQEERASLEEVLTALRQAKEVAARVGVIIDNLEAVKELFNGEPGTKRDGTNAAWDSLTVAADGAVYPAASLVGMEGAAAGNAIEQSLAELWRHSPVFERFRSRSVATGQSNGDPFVFFHGGGDPEHAFICSAGDLSGPDPYVPLYRALLLEAADELIADRVSRIGAREDVPLVYQVMGQDGLGCPVTAGVENSGPHRLDFTHSHCVLMGEVVGRTRRMVQEFYGEAAVVTKGELCCPVQVDRRYLDHIPPVVLERSYGCGSPVFAADIQEGRTVVDLGSGGGVECFVAARKVGRTGRVFGIDMTPEMLSLAAGAEPEVAANLGYHNVRFARGYLEALPLPDDFADVILSNCVINLSPQKLPVFAEIRRVLKPGGRMVISDIVTDVAVPDRVKFHPRLRSECLGGAMTRRELLFLLTKLGFVEVQTVGELPWREVDDVQFFSDTVVAVKPERASRPLPYVNIRRAPTTPPSDPNSASGDHLSGCLLCGAELKYLATPVTCVCAKCGRTFRTRARCAEGHFVCDRCHGGDHLRFLQAYLAQCDETDPVRLFLDLRNAYPFPVHGPEHHALAPAAFLAAYSNRHGVPDIARVWQTVEEAAGLPGGSCGFWGACSATLGLGMAFSLILEATPLTPRPRSQAQAFVAQVLKRLSEFAGARCCRRESLVSLQLACELSGAFLPHSLSTTEQPTCDQRWANAECLGEDCPFA